MRLWQKISLISLAFVMLAIQITQYTLLERSFKNSVQREKETAVAVHEALCASLSNHASYQRLKAEKILLSTTEIDELLSNTVTPEISAASSIHVLRDGEIVAIAGIDIFSGSLEFDLYQLTFDAVDNNGFSVITDIYSVPHLVVCSDVCIETVEYTLFTAYDISDIYITRDKEITSARLTSILYGAAISIVLFIFVWISLHPLKTAVHTIRAAANGNYNLRVSEKGSEEMRVLACSVNHMSASIDEREQKLMETADSRKRFADSMAHEMKTPLTSILGFADILRIQRTISDTQRREYANLIVQEAKHLRSLSSKLLQLASTDGTQLDISAVPIEQLFADTVASFKPIIDQRNIHLDVTHKNAVLQVDRELFLSLLYNLVDNAVKASADNSTIRLIQSHLNGHTIISVIDEGIGMKPDALRHATEAFYMEDKARSRNNGGVGLGLALCEDICRKHGARMEISSVYQKGTAVAIYMDTAHLSISKVTGSKEKEALK